MIVVLELSGMVLAYHEKAASRPVQKGPADHLENRKKKRCQAGMSLA